MHKPLVLVAVVTALLQTACVTGHRDLALSEPTEHAVAVTKGKVCIVSVTDDRAFEVKPKEPSTPSFNGDLSKLTPAEKDRLIGRQRNGFGGAMGDIRLAEGDAVTTRMKKLVAQGFKESGYEVVADPAGAIPVSVSVDKLWAWFTPGFTVLTFEVNIAAKITLTTPGKTVSFIATGYGKNHGQVAKDGNWKEAFAPAFDDFLANFKREIGNGDLP